MIEAEQSALDRRDQEGGDRRAEDDKRREEAHQQLRTSLRSPPLSERGRAPRLLNKAISASMGLSAATGSTVRAQGIVNAGPDMAVI